MVKCYLCGQETNRMLPYYHIALCEDRVCVKKWKVIEREHPSHDDRQALRMNLMKAVALREINWLYQGSVAEKSAPKNPSAGSS